MKLSMLFLLAAVALAVASVSVGEALAKPSHAAAPKTLRIVMHDPGCHWFLTGGKFERSAAAASPIRVANFDMSTLEAASHGTTVAIPVGKSVVLGRGSYTITMVGQAPDDNHLKLTVR